MFLCCNCSSWSLADIIQTCLAGLACVLAILIPVKISWEQRYSQLLADYRGYDFGAAVIGITMFFHNNCKNDVNLIQKEYKKIFDAQFNNQLKRIQKDFTSKEANLLKILYYMNDAAVTDGIFMDITTDDRLTPNAQSINKYIKHIYNVLKYAKPYVR